jgi:hypothetical protein
MTSTGLTWCGEVGQDACPGLTGRFRRQSANPMRQEARSRHPSMNNLGSFGSNRQRSPDDLKNVSRRVTDWGVCLGRMLSALPAANLHAGPTINQKSSLCPQNLAMQKQIFTMVEVSCASSTICRSRPDARGPHAANGCAHEPRFYQLHGHVASKWWQKAKSKGLLARVIDPDKNRRRRLRGVKASTASIGYKLNGPPLCHNRCHLRA